MSLFVEVNSVEKQCPIIINLDHIVEIAPLKDGGCALFIIDSSGKSSMLVDDSYEMFKQFAMQTVTVDDIAKKFPKVTKKENKEDIERLGVSFDDIPTLSKKK
jgi:hypothetical protein